MVSAQRQVNFQARTIQRLQREIIELKAQNAALKQDVAIASDQRDGAMTELMRVREIVSQGE